MKKKFTFVSVDFFCMPFQAVFLFEDESFGILGIEMLKREER
jgi:hypothetical protein